MVKHYSVRSVLNQIPLKGKNSEGFYIWCANFMTENQSQPSYRHIWIFLGASSLGIILFPRCIRERMWYQRWYEGFSVIWQLLSSSYCRMAVKCGLSDAGEHVSVKVHLKMIPDVIPMWFIRLCICLFTCKQETRLPREIRLKTGNCSPQRSK